MRINLLLGTDIKDLKSQINEIVKSATDAKVDVDFGNIAAVVSISEEYKNLCVDCRFWDDAGSEDSLIGLCQRKGGRKRFNCKACNEFVDCRG